MSQMRREFRLPASQLLLITRSAVRARPGEPFKFFRLRPPSVAIGGDQEMDSHRGQTSDTPTTALAVAVDAPSITLPAGIIKFA
jgi:hypothetical protein